MNNKLLYYFLDMNYRDPDIHCKVDIGLPLAKVSNKEMRGESLKEKKEKNSSKRNQKCKFYNNISMSFKN